MTKYAVSIRMGSKEGRTVWGDTIEADSAAEAREIAEAAFFDPLVIDPSWDEANREAAERLEEGCRKTRHEARVFGYVVLATKSRARIAA